MFVRVGDLVDECLRDMAALAMAAKSPRRVRPRRPRKAKQPADWRRVFQAMRPGNREAR